MTPEQRQKLYDVLMGGTPEDPEIAYQFALMVEHDLDRLEPVIDGMLAAVTVFPRDWTPAELGVVFIPDGTNIVLHVSLGSRQCCVQVTRAWLKEFGEECVRQSEAP